MSEATKAVFLSYASQDAEAAKRIADALRAAGVEVWFDAEGGLEHGDEWDAKIRRQIKECVLFLPIISANTQAREEGYFRLEWDMAAERARSIASGVAFILPVVVDDTKEPGALVPDRFRSVQWTKLPGGNVPPEVLQRFLKLWSHRTGALKHETTVGRDHRIPPESDKAGFGDPAPQSRRRPVWPWLVLGVLALGAAYLIFKPRRSPEEIAKIVADAQKLATAVAPPAPATPPLSEARQLVDKAYTLIRGLEATREDFALADEYCQRARKLDPDDGEVWAAASQVDAAFGYRGWDTSPERKEQTRVTAERAIRLAPKSVDARLAQAGAWSLFGINRDEREKLLREVLVDQPDNKGALRFLAVTVLAKPDGLEECLALNERAAALPGGDPLALFNNARYLWTRGRPAEGYATLQRALAQKVFPSALVLKMAMEVTWRGDLAAAEATLQQIPQSALQEDRANYEAGLLRYSQGNADAALEIWQAFPRDYYVDFVYDGPKGLLLGLADELDHRDAAAKIEWHAALQLVEKKIAAAPNNPAPYFFQAWLLACLGEKTGAGEALRTFEQLAGIKYAPGQPMPLLLAKIYVRLGRLDEVFAHPPVNELAILRISPDFAALRADPRFGKLAPADDSAAAAESVSREWPKDAGLRRALKLLYARDAIAEDFALAEDIVKPQLAAHPNDPDVATVAAVIAQEFLTRGFDVTETRRSMVQRLTERAVQLAPDNPVALAALGRYLAFISAQLPRAEKLLRRAIELSPDEPRYYRTLLEILRGAPVAAEPLIAQMSARFPRDTLVRYDIARYYKDVNNVAAMERAIDETLALEPLASAMVWKCWLSLEAHGDVAGMKAWLDRVPERQRTQTRVASALATYAEIAGSAGEAIKLLDELPDTWLSDFDFTGPKALLFGNVLTIDGRPDLARLQYEAALAEIKRAEERSPTELRLRRAEFWALLGLGRREEAIATLRILLQATIRPFRVTMNNSWWHGSVRAALLLGQRAPALELLREAADNPTSRMILCHQFDVDPRMAPFRNDPEITGVLAEPKSTPVPVDDKSVAVLAFVNLSDDKANEYFSDGISEELLNVLAKVPGLKVTARTSSFHFKGMNTAIPEIAQQLGVAYVVEGSVRKQGDKVRITAQLIKAADGFHVWSDTFTRDLKDIFAVQDEIAGLVAQNLELKLGAKSAARTVNPEAYALFLQGRAILNRGVPGDYAQAIQCFKDSLALDGGSALTWALLATSYGTAAAQNTMPAGPTYALAREAVNRSLALDPELVEGHLALGSLQFLADWDWARADASLQHALTLAPGDATTLGQASNLAQALGQTERALQLGRQAVALDPLNYFPAFVLAKAYFRAGRFAEMEKLAEQMITVNPAGRYGPVFLAFAHLLQGRTAAAAQTVEQMKPEGFQLMCLALVRHAQGRTAESEAALNELKTKYGQSRGYQIAEVYAYRGEVDRAFEWLENAYRDRDSGLTWLIGDPFMQRLHGDARWSAFLKKMNLPDSPAQ